MHVTYPDERTQELFHQGFSVVVKESDDPQVLEAHVYLGMEVVFYHNGLRQPKVDLREDMEDFAGHAMKRFAQRLSAVLADPNVGN